MNRLDMKTKDISNDNIAFLQEKFPNIIVETENGLKININVLKQELSNEIVDEKKEK